MTTVFAVDDHTPFLATVALVIEATAGFDLVGVAGSAEAATRPTDDGPGILEADVALIDFKLPAASGLDLIQELGVHRESKQRPMLVLMSSYDRTELPWTSVGWQFVDDFLPKSLLSPGELNDRWAAYVERRARLTGEPR